MLGLEALTGSLDEFGFEDYLNGKEILFINQPIEIGNSNHCYSILKFWFDLLQFQ